MDFAKVFTRLSAVEDVRSDAQTASAPRNSRESSKRGKSTKRKPQGERIGPFNKKECFPAQMDNDKFASFKYSNHYQRNTDTKEVTRYQSNKGGYKTIYHQGQNYPARDERNVSKPQQSRKKMEGQNNQHQMKNGWKKNNQMRRGGEDRKHYSYSQDARAISTMTQEFMDQNGVLIDGQLLCRHFLKGKCIKGDECQLKHMQGYNGLIKEGCKFYIQGSCSKGESCLYMHESFPCKFFHRKGKCSQGPNCRFSHKPLNDFTTQLLDEALKRESELAKKAAQESSGQQVTTDESENTPANQPPDVLIQPVRPNFYNSEETNAPQKALQSLVADDVKEAVPPPPPGHSPLSADSTNQEPVCYSVEAVLGRPLFKPFPSFFTTPQSQESSSLSVEKCPPDSANQSEAPYSVDAVLRSCKSVESSTFRRAAQTASYNPKSHFAEVTDSLLSPQNKKVLCSASRRSEEAQGKLFNSLTSHKACPDLTLKSSDLKKEDAVHDVKLELLRSPAVLSEKSFKSITREGCNCKSLTCSKHPTQLKSHVSGLTCNPKASVKTPPPPPPGFSEFKSKAAVSAEHVLCSAKTPDPVDLKQLPEIQQHSKGTESDLRLCTQRQSFNESPAADCSRKMENCCNEPPERSFQSLFASPIASLKATPHSVTTPVSCSTRQSEHSSSNNKPVRTAVEPCKTSTRSFLNLFASPLSAAPVSQPHCTSTTSCSQDSHKPYTSNLSDSNQTASKSETCQKKSDAKQTSHWSSPPSKLSTNPKNENDDSLSEAMKQQANPTCRLVSHSPSTTSSPPACVTHPDRFTAQQRPSLLSHKGSAAAAPDSVLKTLFLHLSPYQQDGQQQHSLHKDKSKVEAQDSHKQSHEKTAVPSTERGSTLCSPAVTEPQLRNFGPHNPPFKAVTSPTQNHTPPRLKLITKELKWVNRNVAVTSFKDLFKSFDTTVHQFGH